MQREQLEQNYPKLMELFADDDEVEEVRHLVVVDVNYDDLDDDEFDVFDPQEYNYLVYITERVQESLGEEVFKSVPRALENSKVFENFFDSEPDLYGIKYSGDEEEVAKIVLNTIEELISNQKES